MKIEKLTENKIRVIMNLADINKENQDIQTFFNEIMGSQKLFLDILEKAEKEVDFHTEGCKLLIEAFSALEDSVIFTITKYLPTENTLNIPQKKKLIAKRKSSTPVAKTSIYKFDNFDTFCDFCNSISNISSINISKIAKKIILYDFQGILYLILNNINYNYINIHKFFSLLNEFATIKNYSNSFESKLLEHGNTLMKNNAIIKGIQYFANKS